MRWSAATVTTPKKDVNELVPGDVIELTLGELVPADVRLITVNGLECNESILTGESTATEKSITSGSRCIAGGLCRSRLHGNCGVRRRRDRGGLCHRPGRAIR